ncbi:MAG: alcohol dehydrogenase catalytic domain-containing protein [Synergistaceae bacterium]|jgi:threonine 3-dehydrogenase|nr:alcohol dehydrogenase catalytic domain-containing protein [Synergistaceae bacterium]
MMNAFVKKERKYGASYEKIPIPQPLDGEVLIEIASTAICGTDIHIYAWNAWAQANIKQVPITMGHEFVGRVVETGPGCKSLKVNDVVSGETHIPCGQCYQCRNGMRHICLNLQLPGIHRDGSFAEYLSYPEMCLVKLPASIPVECGALMEPLGVGVSAVENAQVAGGNVVVIGSGPIGLGVICAAQAMGAGTITALDISEYRLSLAAKCGADYAINPSETDPNAFIGEKTQGVGADVIFDASGNSAAIAGAFKYLRKGGSVHLLGLPSTPTSIDLASDVIFKEATIHGYHGRKMFQTWTRMINLLESGKIDLGSMISHRMPLSEAGNAFEMLEKGENASKILLVPER